MLHFRLENKTFRHVIAISQGDTVIQDLKNSEGAVERCSDTKSTDDFETFGY